MFRRGSHRRAAPANRNVSPRTGSSKRGSHRRASPASRKVSPRAGSSKRGSHRRATSASRKVSPDHSSLVERLPEGRALARGARCGGSEARSAAGGSEVPRRERGDGAAATGWAAGGRELARRERGGGSIAATRSAAGGRELARRERGGGSSSGGQAPVVSANVGARALRLSWFLRWARTPATSALEGLITRKP